MTAAQLKEKKAHVWERDDLNWYSEPPSCAHALFDVEDFDGTVLDPCCGMGNLVHAGIARGLQIKGRDICPRPVHFHAYPGREYAFDDVNSWDFLAPQEMMFKPDNVVMNPPYGYSKTKVNAKGETVADTKSPRWEVLFIDRALELARRKVAVFLPLTWFVTREDWLLQRGLIRIWAVTPRPSVPNGASIAAGKRPGGGLKDFAWFVFARGADCVPWVIGHARRDCSHDDPKNWTWRLGA